MEMSTNTHTDRYNTFAVHPIDTSSSSSCSIKVVRVSAASSFTPSLFSPAAGTHTRLWRPFLPSAGNAATTGGGGGGSAADGCPSHCYSRKYTVVAFNIRWHRVVVISRKPTSTYLLASDWCSFSRKNCCCQGVGCPGSMSMDIYILRSIITASKARGICRHCKQIDPQYPQ